jgi:NADPH2:quinone reductase
MNAITLHRHGSPAELQWGPTGVVVPGPGQVAVDVVYAGVNFMDIGVRKGMLWRDQSLPLVPGVEGMGVVSAVGASVSSFHEGQRVAWPYVPGSYTQRLVANADALVPVPDDITDEAAAAAMLQGLTARHIALRFHRTRPGDVALVHAAAGGVGSLITQLVKMRGGTVIARVSSDGKVPAAEAAGADHVLVASDGGFASQVLELTQGRGVDVVFDGSGAVTFADSLASLAPLGTLAYFGPVLGAPAPINVATLPRSVKIGFPIYSDSLRTVEELREASAELFSWMREGQLRVQVSAFHAMADAAAAHEAIESRRTTGKLLLKA